MRRPWKLGFLLFAAIIMATSLLSLTSSPRADATNPGTISFQGKVVNANGTNVANNTYNFTFNIYTVASGGTSIWTETDSLTVTNGIFQVNLGATTSLASINFNTNPALYLGITFNSDPAGEMTPRVQLQSVPFAFNANTVGGVSASQIVQLSPGSAQTGGINLTYSAAANATANSIALSNTNAGATASTLNALNLSLQGVADSSATNTNNAVNFASVTGVTGGVFNGINFATGYSNILEYNNTSIINGGGLFGIAGLSSSTGTTQVCSNGTNLSSCSASILSPTATNFIENQATQQASSNFNISGTGIAGVALQAPALDTSAAGTLSIGTTNATAISIGGSTITTTVNGPLAVSSGETIAANQSLTLTTGTGSLVQGYSSNATGNARALTVTDTATTGNNTINGDNISITEATNSNTSTVNGINFATVSVSGTNAINAINVGTGYSSILDYPNTGIIISGTGKLTNNGFASATSYTNLQNVGNLNGTSFTATGAIQAATATLGTIGTSAGSLTLADASSGGSFILTPLSGQTTTTTLDVPNDNSNSTDIICLQTLKNCSGANAGSGDTSYIYNQTTQQASSNFNISGTGSAVVLDATASSGVGLAVTNNATVGGTLGVTGLTSLGGSLTFTGGTSTITGTSGSSLTLQSAGSGQLILNSASATLGIAATTTTLQQVTTGTTGTTFTIDLDNTNATTTNTTLELYNSGAGVANLQLYGGGICTGSAACTTGGSTMRLDNTGDLTNIVAITASGEETLSKTNSALDFSGTLAGSATTSLLQFASAITGGVAAGTYIGVNQPSGGTADFLDFQTNGTKELEVSSTGALTATLSVTTATVNATTSYQAGGTAGVTEPSCGGAETYDDIVTKEGITTSVGACSATGLSDERLKTDIIPISGNDVLDQLENVNPVTFEYDCSNPYFAEYNQYCAPGPQAGVLAQQLMGVLPNLVDQNLPDGYYTVNYPGLSVYTLEGVKQLAQYINGDGNAQLAVISANSITTSGDVTVGGNLTVDGNLSYNSTTTPRGTFTSSVITPALTSDGALTINSGSEGDVNIDTSDTTNNVNIGTTSANNVNLSREGQVTNVNGNIVINGGSTFNSGATMNFTGSNNLSLTTDLNSNVNALSIVATPSTKTNTSSGIFVQQADSTNPDGLSSGLTIDNANSTTPIGSAITISNSGGAGYKDIINSPNFKVDGLGDISASNLQVSLSGGGTFNLTDSSGNSLMSVDADGNETLAGNLNVASATVSGGLSVGGDLNVAGLSTFQKLATFLASTVFKQNVEFDGHITVASDTASYASLRTGESSVNVTFATPYATPPVVTADIVNGQFGLVSVNNVTTTGFTISLAIPATASTTFAWTAVAVNNPLTATNPLPSTSSIVTPPTGSGSGSSSTPTTTSP